MRTVALVSLAALAIAGCAVPGRKTGTVAPIIQIGQVVEAPITNAAGERIGDARFTEGPRGVLIRLEMRPGALAPGWHGVHIHEIGTCEDAATGFTGSGSHFGHERAGVHGLLNADGPEAGDLPNLHAPQNGAIAAEFYSSLVTLEDRVRDRLSLLDADGAALIIHANPDDQTTQPIGGAGARVACAALRP
jgi:Cu-Zn family superoxide dismutase